MASARRGQPEFSRDHGLWGSQERPGPLVQKGLGPQVGSTDRVSAFSNVFSRVTSSPYCLPNNQLLLPILQDREDLSEV